MSICAIFAFVSVVSSCSKEEIVSLDSQSLSGDSRANDEQQLEEMRAAAKKLLWYLDLEDGCRYVVTISQPEAERLLGVNKAQYEAVVADFNEVNRLTQIELEKAKTNPYYEVIINTPEELIAANITGIPTRGSVNPNNPLHGALKCPGGDVQASWPFRAASWVEKVRFYVLLNSPGSGWNITCGTIALGQRNSKTVLGTSFLNREVVVPVAASNTTVTVFLNTGAPNGASCGWEAIGGEYL